MKHLHTALVSLLLISCQRYSAIQSNISSAERLLNSHPDSSLAILLSIDTCELTTQRLKADYALWLSAALDKNYIDLTTDSLIQTAVNYYDNRTLSKQRMLARYYQGIVNENNASYSTAIVSFEKAQEDAESLNNCHYLGMIHRHIGACFDASNNFQESIKAHENSVQCFSLTGEKDYLDYAKLSLATVLLNNREFSKALSVINELRSDSSIPQVLSNCNIIEAEIQSERNMPPRGIIDLYRTVPIEEFCLIDYGYLARAFNLLSQYDSTDFYLKKGYEMAQDEADSASLDYMRSHIYFNRGELRDAYPLLDHATTVQDSLTRHLLKESVTGAQRDLYKHEASFQEERAREIRTISMLSWLFACIFILFAALLLFFYDQKQKRRIKELMMERAIHVSQIKQVHTEKASLIGTLFYERISTLDKLSEMYLKEEDSKKKGNVFDDYCSFLKKAQHDKELYRSLENDLNLYCDNVILKLRALIPSIKGEHLQIIELFFAQIPYKTVMLLMNRVSVESLKTARSRFRKTILESDAPDKELFLDLLKTKRATAGESNKKEAADNSNE